MDSKYEAVSIGGHGKIAYSSHLNRPDGKFRTISIESKSDVLAVKQINKVSVGNSLHSVKSPSLISVPLPE